MEQGLGVDSVPPFHFAVGSCHESATYSRVPSYPGMMVRERTTHQGVTGTPPPSVGRTGRTDVPNLYPPGNGSYDVLNVCRVAHTLARIEDIIRILFQFVP